MKKLLIFIYLLIGGFSLNAKPLTFSDSVAVSLITCSPGEKIYARFGHTAVRVNDPVNHIDIVFNYGIFDFNSKNFYMKFIMGETDYSLAAYDFIYFLPEYEKRNSTVWEQKLNLNRAEKQRLIELLMINHCPENRVYRYNFVFDNCSTRPRDKVVESLDGRLEYHRDESAETFRDWVGRYVGTDTWLKFGIDMIFGDDADIPASRNESMFLPEALMKEFQMAEVVVKHGDVEERRPLVSEYKPLLSTAAAVEESGQYFLLTPLASTIFLLCLGVLFLYKDKRYHYFYKAFDSLLFAIVGLIGCIAFFLSFISLHPLVGHNTNIMWLNPLFLFVAIAQWIKPLKPFVLFVMILNAVLIFVILVQYALSLHYFNTAFLPLILLFLLRTVNYVRIRMRKMKRKVPSKLSCKGKL